MARNPIITLTTDFGTNDHFIGAMKGVILSIEPDAQIIDICHAVQAFDVLDGALTISQAYSYFPTGTIHMVIVDPGVGTARRPLIVSSDRHHFVAPDNGVLSLIYQREQRLSARHVTGEHYFLQPVSQTFHARESFRQWPRISPRVWTRKSSARRSPILYDSRRPSRKANENTLRGGRSESRPLRQSVELTPQDAPMLFGRIREHSRLWSASAEIRGSKKRTRKARPAKCSASWAAWATSNRRQSRRRGATTGRG